MPTRGALKDYDALPEAVRSAIRRDEWAWMSTEQRLRAQDELVNPDWDAEDPPA